MNDYDKLILQKASENNLFVYPLCEEEKKLTEIRLIPNEVYIKKDSNVVFLGSIQGAKYFIVEYPNIHVSDEAKSFDKKLKFKYKHKQTQGDNDEHRKFNG